MKTRKNLAVHAVVQQNGYNLSTYRFIHHKDMGVNLRSYFILKAMLLMNPLQQYHANNEGIPKEKPNYDLMKFAFSESTGVILYTIPLGIIEVQSILVKDSSRTIYRIAVKKEQMNYKLINLYGILCDLVEVDGIGIVHGSIAYYEPITTSFPEAVQAAYGSYSAYGSYLTH